jgi:hypothetical protein
MCCKFGFERLQEQKKRACRDKRDLGDVTYLACGYARLYFLDRLVGVVWRLGKGMKFEPSIFSQHARLCFVEASFLDCNCNNFCCVDDGRTMRGSLNKESFAAYKDGGGDEDDTAFSQRLQLKESKGAKQKYINGIKYASQNPTCASTFTVMSGESAPTLTDQ